MSRRAKVDGSPASGCDRVREALAARGMNGALLSELPGLCGLADETEARAVIEQLDREGEPVATYAEAFVYLDRITEDRRAYLFAEARVWDMVPRVHAMPGSAMYRSMKGGAA